MKINIKWVLSILCFVLVLKSGNAQTLNSIEWDRVTGYCESSGRQIKCSAKGWNSGSVSKDVLPLSEDGEIEIVVQEVSSYKMVGLGRNSTTNHYRDIEYALYQAQRRLYIYESGTKRLVGPGLVIGDLIEIHKINNRIHYFHNEKLIYVSGRNVTIDLFVSGSSHTVGSILPDVKASFANERIQPTVSINMVTTKKNTRVIEIGDQLGFYYQERYHQSEGSQLSFSIYNISDGKRKLVPKRDFPVERGLNTYQCGLTELISQGDLKVNDHYRIEIYGNKGEYRYFDFVYKN